MRVSSLETNRLRSCKRGTLLSMNSFVSTSLSSTVAMMYLGTDPERDIMLEILIDKSSLDSSSSPFADIRTVSAFPDEEEVLLPMGTTLQVQRVTSDPQTKKMHIQTQLCYEEDATLKDLKTHYIEQELCHGKDELYYPNILTSFLSTSGDSEKIEQLLKLSKSRGGDGTINELCQSFTQMRNSSLYSIEEHDISRLISLLTFKLPEALQLLVDNPRVPTNLRDCFSSMSELFTSLACIKGLNENEGDVESILAPLMSIIPLFEQIGPLLSFPPSHPMWSSLSMMKGMCEAIQGNHLEALQYFETDCASPSASLIDNNNLGRHRCTLSMAESAAALGHNDLSRQILEDQLTSARPKADTLLELAKYHERDGDLPMAIVCYRSAIEDCNLPPNSIEIVEAYSSLADCFFKLDDTESALLNYRRARDLLLRHHPPTHRRLTSIQLHIQLLELKQMMQQISETLH